MKFLFHFYDLEQRAGIQRAICELSNALVESGHEVVVATHSRAKDVVYFLDARVNVIATSQPEYKKSGLPAWPVKALWAVRQVIVLRRLIKAHRPAILVDHGTAIGLVYPFRRLAGVPFVLQRHFPASSFPNGKLLYAVLSVLNRSKAVVVLTDGIAREMRKSGFRNLWVIPNPIPSEAKFEPVRPSSEHLGLLMGRAKNPQKGFDIFLKALSLSRPKGWKFVMIGPGVDTDSALRALVQEYDLSAIITLLPATSDPYSWIRQCACLIMPSRYEALPMVALEALSIGRPVLASDVDGLKEVIQDGVNGRIFPKDNVRELAELLDEIALRPQVLTELAKQSPGSITRFNRGSIVKKWVELSSGLAR